MPVINKNDTWMNLFQLYRRHSRPTAGYSFIYYQILISGRFRCSVVQAQHGTSQSLGWTISSFIKCLNSRIEAASSLSSPFNIAFQHFLRQTIFSNSSDRSGLSETCLINSFWNLDYYWTPESPTFPIGAPPPATVRINWQTIFHIYNILPTSTSWKVYAQQSDHIDRGGRGSFIVS